VKRVEITLERVRVAELTRTLGDSGANAVFVVRFDGGRRSCRRLFVVSSKPVTRMTPRVRRLPANRARCIAVLRRARRKLRFSFCLHILCFINRHFIFGATLSLTWHGATLAAPTDGTPGNDSSARSRSLVDDDDDDDAVPLGNDYDDDYDDDEWRRVSARRRTRTSASRC